MKAMARSRSAAPTSATAVAPAEIAPPTAATPRFAQANRPWTLGPLVRPCTARLAAAGHCGCVAVRLVFKLAMRAVEEMDGGPARLLDGVRDLVCEQGNVGRPFTLREEHVDAPGEGTDAQLCSRGRGQRVGVNADRARIHAQTVAEPGGHVRRQHVPRTGRGDGTADRGSATPPAGLHAALTDVWPEPARQPGFPWRAQSLGAQGNEPGQPGSRWL